MCTACLLSRASSALCLSAAGSVQTSSQVTLLDISAAGNMAVRDVLYVGASEGSPTWLSPLAVSYSNSRLAVSVRECGAGCRGEGRGAHAAGRARGSPAARLIPPPACPWPSAVAVSRTAPGEVRVYGPVTSGSPLLGRVSTCAYPDAIAWSRDGSRIFSTCEGEPAAQSNATVGSDPTLLPNPAGEFVIIDVEEANAATGELRLSPLRLSFQTYLASLSAAAFQALLAAGLRIDPRLASLPGGLQANAGLDVEPEYIALDDTGNYAYVTLQENNAIARIRVTRGSEAIEAIYPLGWKNWATYRLDPSDQ